MSKRTEKVAELMERALEEVERAVGVRLADEKVEERGRQALPVFLHELLHEAVDQAFPGLFDPRDPKADLVGEVLVRVLEDEIGRKLGLTGHTPEEHLAELAGVFPHLRLSVKDYEELTEHWRKYRDVHLFAEKVLKMLWTGRKPEDTWLGAPF